MRRENKRFVAVTEPEFTLAGVVNAVDPHRMMMARKKETPREGRRAGNAITGGVTGPVAQSVRVIARGIKVYEGSTC